MNGIGDANRLTRMGENARAIKDLRALTRRAKPMYSHYENLGWELERRGRIREAIRAYQEAYRLFPGAARATSCLLRYKQYLVHGNRLCKIDRHDKPQMYSEEHQIQMRESRELSEEEAMLVAGTNFDGERLEDHYAHSSMSLIPDTFALIRIIGNDLPPRHAEGQSLKNLEFILEYEPELYNCTRLWIVNRIFIKEVHDAIISLLTTYKQEFIDIPFKAAEYAKATWDFSLHPQPGFLSSKEFLKLDAEKRIRARNSTYRHKNLYLMNNNGARIKALKAGRTRAKWVLPWDGNCIVNEQAWDQITSGVVSKPYLKYFVVPMQRLSTNSEFLDEGINITAREEPQLVFRQDASESFDAHAPYGRRPKVRLFWRLGIPGVWNNWKDDPWDIERTDPSTEAGEYGIAGYTFRLSPMDGTTAEQPHLLVGSDGRKTRNAARLTAIIFNIHKIERSLSLQNPQDHIRYYSTTAIQSAKRLSEEATESPFGRLVKRVIHKANAIVLGRALQIDHKDDTYKALEEQIRFNTPLGASRDILSAGSLSSSISEQIVPLALAWKLRPDPAYVRKANSLLKQWLNENSNIDAHRDKEHIVRLTTLTGLDSLLAAIELIGDAEEFDVATRDSLDRQLIALSELIHDQESRSIECLSVNHVGTYHDLYQSALYVYLGDYSGMMDLFLRLQSRILGQIDKEGKQNNELIGNQTQHYTFKNLMGFMNAFRILAAGGAPRLNVMSEPAQRLRRALDWILEQDLLEWPYLQTHPFDPNLIWPLLDAALNLGLISYKQLPGSGKAMESVILKDSFGGRTGVPMYWNLSLFSRLYGLHEDIGQIEGGAKSP